MSNESIFDDRNSTIIFFYPFLGHLDPFGPHIEIPKIRLYLKSGMEETEIFIKF